AELVRQLSAQGVEIHVAAFDSGDGGNTEVLQAVEGHVHQVARIPCKGPLDRQAFQSLNRYIAEHRIDLVHSHKYKTTFYALPGRLLGRFRLVTTYHNWITHTPALKFYAWLDKRLARLNDAAVAVSTPVAQELRRHMPVRKVHQIDNGIDTRRYARQMPREQAKVALGLDPARPVLGFVGRLSQEKGLPYLIEALSTQPDVFRDVQVVIVGEGEVRSSLVQLIEERGLSGQVKLFGNRRDTPLIYSALDVFTLPSILEAFPMVILEAMACGCPVVATDVGEVSRIIDAGLTGWIVPPRAPQALAQALASVLHDPAHAQDIATRAQQKVQDLFSSSAMAQRYLEIYQVAMA
ncbi:MAG TPA: glycosyltransferase family 4 protein, partial [Aquabacterium sp.]|nr:glycosyltransferase family 4 protein [Aquabacterium sp.]